MKKYRELSYGELSPHVIWQPPFDDPELVDNALRTRLNREGEAAICAEFSRCVIYPKLMEVATSSIRIERSGCSIPLRIYQPLKAGNGPAMLFCHGGSFCYNSIDVYDYVLRYLARMFNILCIAVDYRLAPEHRFPAGLTDCKVALEWVSTEFCRQDGRRLCVAGDSSGGNFAAALALMSKDGLTPPVDLQILIYPVLDLTDTREGSFMRYGKGYFLEAAALRRSYQTYLPRPEEAWNPLVSPLLAADFKGAAPALLVAAECDILVDDGLEYAQKLSDAGTPVDYQLYKGMPHAFLGHAYQETFAALDVIGNQCCHI